MFCTGDACRACLVGDVIGAPAPLLAEPDHLGVPAGTFCPVSDAVRDDRSRRWPFGVITAFGVLLVAPVDRLTRGGVDDDAAAERLFERHRVVGGPGPTS